MFGGLAFLIDGNMEITAPWCLSYHPQSAPMAEEVLDLVQQRGRCHGQS